jgi:hypothetical protein
LRGLELSVYHLLLVGFLFASPFLFLFCIIYLFIYYFFSFFLSGGCLSWTFKPLNFLVMILSTIFWTVDQKRSFRLGSWLNPPHPPPASHLVASEDPAAGGGMVGDN